MDKNQAKSLIQETFNNSFDRSRFIKFVKELLNEIDEGKAQSWNKQYVKHDFHDGVKRYERIGTYTAPEGEKIDILIVYLEKDFTLERARTLQRNFVAYHLKKRAEKEAGLVAFVSPNGEDWRFSLVKMEYHLEQTDGGKVKAEEELTPSKRCSFIVGKNENSHTAQKQLLPILEDDKNNPTLKEIEKAFSIETVTKEFFNKYKELFLNFKDEFDKILEKDKKITEDFRDKGINTADFAKKLLGQIVFLYFLQRKGWLGVDKNEHWGSGPKNFLRALFDKKYAGYNNFFNDILEPLFYEALATDRGEKAYYSRFDCRIPFLNGGLFEPIQNYDWENTDIIIPNDLFSNDYKTKEGDIGSGILDFFDRYNFTIKEDEPLEKEVAIDPEMLGKVFENLLEVKDRKSKGAYYTPREIVHYMCQESLINYLATESEGKVPKEDIETFIHLGDFAVEHDMAKTQGIIKDDGKYKLPQSIHENAELIDEKLADITVCDPAIGSGAFPVGMMNEIVRARGALNATKTFKDTKSKRTPYSFKRHAIQNSLYGVDIDPGAVEIAKLRLWLSLVVDEEEMADIKPLPNLDYKIMQGNSLLEEYEGIKLFDESLILDTGAEKKIRQEEIGKRKSVLQQEYFKLHSSGKLNEIHKSEIEKEMKSLQKEESGLNKVEASESSSLFDQESIAKKKAEELNLLHKEFFDIAQKSNKAEIKKRIDELEWELIEETLKEHGKEKELPKLQILRRSNNKPFFLWKLHFAEVFLKKGGFDVVIGNPPWEKFKPLDPEFFSNYDEDYRELSKAKQKSKRDELLKNPLIQASYAEYIKKYEDEAESFKKYYKLQGSGDLNLYKLFLERAYQLASANVTFLIPGQITIDNGSIVFRETFLKDKSLYRIIGLINRKGLFENVHLEQRFVLLFLDKKSKHDAIETYGWSYYFKNFQNSQLLKLRKNFFEEFDDNKTYYLDTNKLNYAIFEKMKASPVSMRLSDLNYHIWREYDVTMDSKYFNDESGKFKLSSGQAISHYDSMAKKWIENHGRSSKWKKVILPKPEDYRTEYFVSEVPERILEHHKEDKSNFRIVTQTVTGAVTNSRTLNAAILPKKYLTNNSLNNLFVGHSDEELFYYLAILDSFIVDWQVRGKIATNLNKYILDSIIVPCFEKADGKIREKIWRNCIRLSAVSEDFDEITQKYFGKKHGEVLVCDVEERQHLKNEIDFLVTQIWGLSKDEIKNILDSFPLVNIAIKTDILGRFTY